MKLQDFTFDPDIETYRANHLAEIRAWGQAHSPIEGPIQVEIGSNRGRFLKGMAALHPEHTVLGVEIRRKFAELVAEELAAEGPSNALSLCGDANLALPLLFADGELERLFVLFPDPWWKKRHAKRRILTPEFLLLVARKLRPGGQMIIKTDVEPYADYVREVVQSVDGPLRLLEPGDPAWPQDEERWPKTTREAKILRDGLPIWRFYLTRTEQPMDSLSTEGPLPQERFPKPDQKPSGASRSRVRSTRG